MLESQSLILPTSHIESFPLRLPGKFEEERTNEAQKHSAIKHEGSILLRKMAQEVWFSIFVAVEEGLPRSNCTSPVLVYS